MGAFIQLNRLIVFRRGQRVYDQEYHEGLNIIYGTNGSGKSTIADLIFYSLGGNLEKWKEHALLCDEVVAEYTMSGTTVTLKRDIEEKSLRPMRIFYGPISTALETASDGWTLANFVRDSGDRRNSFSQILFKILGIPEIPGDGGGNITMHQILRLMYVDQTSPFQRIFRAERFDAKDTKQAVAELMCGIGGYDLYSLKLTRRQKKSEFDAAAAKFSNLSRATIAFDQNFGLDAINAESAVAKQKIESLHKELKELETAKIDQGSIARDAADKRRKLFGEMSKYRADIIQNERLEKSLLLEIEDSKAFISHLEELLEEFENSATAFVTLGSVAFTNCPSCFSALSRQHADACGLCGNQVSEDEREAKALQIKMDIEGQLKESRFIQEERLGEVSQLQSALRKRRSAFTRLSKQMDELSELPVDGRTALVSQLSRSIGALDARLLELEKLRKIADDLDDLAQKKKDLNNELNDMDDAIKALERSKDTRRRQVLTAINENTKFFLRKDMQEHTDFEKLEEFAFNFEDDWFAVNGNPNISTSASGMVMIKNSLMLGILKSAMEDPKMQYPKFLIQDNGEDKGMVGDRVRHFQEIMAEWSDSKTIDHQIILTTSTINPELETDEYMVGPKYTKLSRTLDFILPASQSI